MSGEDRSRAGVAIVTGAELGVAGGSAAAQLVAEVRERAESSADVVAFAGLSGDFNPLHTDETHAAAGPFGTRVAHGLLCAAIASGLFTKTELSLSLQPSLIAMLAVDARLTAPLFIGDTISVRATVTELHATSKPDRGVATIQRVVLKQDGSHVQEITTSMLLKRCV